MSKYGRRIPVPGEYYGYYKVIAKTDKRKYRTYLWFCVCVCGNMDLKIPDELFRERETPLNCGCKRPKPLIEHRNYMLFHGMKARCNNPNDKAYKNYGGRGITICDRWNDPVLGFENFCQDMGDRPEGLSLDRTDCNKGYSPDNCQWRSRSDQSKNRRPKYKYKGIYKVRDGLYTASVCGELLGSFETDIEAAKAYDRRARELGYEEVWLNFPQADKI